LGAIPPFEFAFFYAKPHAAVLFKKLWRFDHPHRYKRKQLFIILLWKGGITMDERTVITTEKQIGDTLYIIETAVSSTAKETAFDKLKRMILNDTKSLEIKKAS
jgi:hypothetical protein